MAKLKTAIEDFKPDPTLVDERGPTKERIARADGEVVRGMTGVITARDAPIERMHAREAFGRDHQTNDRRYNALVKFRHHWFRAGLAGGISTIDPNHVFATDWAAFSGMAKTEAQVFHRQRYRDAVQELGMRRSCVLEMVACYEKSLEEAGRTLSWGNKAQAIAAATEVLIGCADDLCEMWGIS